MLNANLQFLKTTSSVGRSRAKRSKTGSARAPRDPRCRVRQWHPDSAPPAASTARHPALLELRMLSFICVISTFSLCCLPFGLSLWPFLILNRVCSQTHEAVSGQRAARPGRLHLSIFQDQDAPSTSGLDSGLSSRVMQSSSFIVFQSFPFVLRPFIIQPHPSPDLK